MKFHYKLQRKNIQALIVNLNPKIDKAFLKLKM